MLATPTIGVRAVVVASTATSDELVYAVTRTVFEHLPELRTLHLAFAGATAEEVFRASAAGDPAARAEIEAFVRGVAPGIATVTMAVDPDVVVVGGGLSRAGEELRSMKMMANRSIIGASPCMSSVVTNAMQTASRTCRRAASKGCSEGDLGVRA